MAKSKAGQSQNMAKLRFDNGFGCLPAAALMLLLAWAAPGLLSPVKKPRKARQPRLRGAGGRCGSQGACRDTRRATRRYAGRRRHARVARQERWLGTGSVPGAFGRRGCGADRRSRDAGSGADGRASAAIRSGSQSWRQPAPWRHSFEHEHGGDGARSGFDRIMAEAPAAGLARRRYRRAAVAMPSADCWTVMRRLRPPHRPPQLEAPMEECQRARA